MRLSEVQGALRRNPAFAMSPSFPRRHLPLWRLTPPDGIAATPGSPFRGRNARPETVSDNFAHPSNTPGQTNLRGKLIQELFEFIKENLPAEMPPAKMF
jgi:hypothetical protein